ncbi:MAG: hypothetical protein A2Z03_12030 [Chloroflexi bacterium RBG_16_56_8]|nr:MAG: hypothetical protein A2Z03_12030 [Chloroflexi bacterium RBG_16_56_8]
MPVGRGNEGKGLRRLPIRGYDSLHLIRVLVDRLIPGDAAMRSGELGHRLDQLVDLGIGERPVVDALEGFDVIGAGRVPGVDG